MVKEYLLLLERTWLGPSTQLPYRGSQPFVTPVSGDLIYTLLDPSMGRGMCMRYLYIYIYVHIGQTLVHIK